MKQFHYLFHGFFYYFAWVVCIVFAAKGKPWLSTGIVLVLVSFQYYWQYKIYNQSAGLNYLVILLTSVGTAIDSILQQFGLITFAANPFLPYLSPPWMMTIWVSFAVVLYSTLSRLFDHLWLLAILSLIGFSFAYSVGVKMGAASFPKGYSTALLVGTIWMWVLPASIYVYKKTKGILC